VGRDHAAGRPPALAGKTAPRASSNCRQQGRHNRTCSTALLSPPQGVLFAVVLAARAWCTRETNLRMIRRHHTSHAQRLRASPKSVDIAFRERTRKICGKPGHSARAGPPGDARATNTAQATPLGYAAGSSAQATPPGDARASKHTGNATLLERAGYATACGLSWARFEGVAYAVARATPLDSKRAGFAAVHGPTLESSRAVSKGLGA
jgi:hypothetical protein